MKKKIESNWSYRKKEAEGKKVCVTLWSKQENTNYDVEGKLLAMSDMMNICIRILGEDHYIRGDKVIQIVIMDEQ